MVFIENPRSELKSAEHGVEMAARQTAGQPWGTAVLAANANSHAPHATSSGFARPRIAKAAGFLVYPA